MFLRLRVKLIASGSFAFMMAGSAVAQCAMCKATLAGDPNAAAASRQMNMAVLLLLIPAVIIFTGFFVLMYRYRDSFKNSPPTQGVGPASRDDLDPGSLPAFRGSIGPQTS